MVRIFGHPDAKDSPGKLTAHGFRAFDGSMKGIGLGTTSAPSARATKEIAVSMSASFTTSGWSIRSKAAAAGVE
jgi:hypothetical protein